jgi:hypothetical protein
MGKIQNRGGVIYNSSVEKNSLEKPPPNNKPTFLPKDNTFSETAIAVTDDSEKIDLNNVLLTPPSQTKTNKAVDDGKHSFLFWLIVPLVVIWLTAGYFVGLIKEHPSWSKTGYALEINDNIEPFTKDYPKISGKTGNGFVTLWFDDAWLSQYMVAYPLLKQHDFLGTIAVAVDAVEKPDYANWAQLRILAGDNWEITNHSKSHDCKMQTWDSMKISQELKIASLALWKNQLTSDFFVTPCGVDSETLREEVRKNFLGYRTVDPGFNPLNNIDFYHLKVKNVDSHSSLDQIKSWVDYAKETNSWLILVFHKAGETGTNSDDEEYNTTKADLAATLDYIDKLNLQVVVPSQMLETFNR